VDREPDILIPSDRQIPVSVNDGKPIVIVEERSEVARSFRALANLYTDARQEPAPVASNGAAPTERQKRRFAWR
ncbi:MAG TPA: hypothetical protein VE269_06160, partial [Gaiellaceae bacterium]|nr:hypothetical protein [Gaiellaceae bacterium]